MIAAREYIDEQGQAGRKAQLYGQEANGTVWSIAKMNMLLHGISTADLQNDDTRAKPRHVKNGVLTRFDRILTNPPFSLPWGSTDQDRDGQTLWAPDFREQRFAYGEVPLGAKKADLMNVSASTLNRVLKRQSCVSPEMALRLSKSLGRSPESWLAMQDAYDLWHAKARVGLAKLERIVPDAT